MQRYTLMEPLNKLVKADDGEWLRWEEHRELIKKISHLLAENYVEYCPICMRCRFTTHEGRFIRHKEDCDLYVGEGK